MRDEIGIFRLTEGRRGVALPHEGCCALQHVRYTALIVGESCMSQSIGRSARPVSLGDRLTQPRGAIAAGALVIAFAAAQLFAATTARAETPAAKPAGSEDAHAKVYAESDFPSAV